MHRASMGWRALYPKELDHEKLWLTVGLGACALGGTWLAWDLPRPVCNFRALTGWPCPTCGSTRAAIALTDADVVRAIQWNPLATVVFGLCALYLVYAAVVVTLRLPRWRPAVPSARGQLALRIGAVALILLNWIYLFWASV